MKRFWDSGKEARTIAAFSLIIVAAATYFAGYYDNVSTLEYWCLNLLALTSIVLIERFIAPESYRTALIWLFLSRIVLGAAIYWRQNKRWNDYEITYDLPFANVSTLGKLGVQVGVCAANPNPFPVYIKVTSIVVNLNERSGSYSEPQGKDPLKIGKFSTNASTFSDIIPVPEAPTAIVKGVLRSDIEYGRVRDKLDKKLTINNSIEAIRDSSGLITGFSTTINSGDSPNNYALLPYHDKWRCDPTYNQ